MTTQHVTNIAHGETVRDGKTLTWAHGTCSCGWEGVPFTSDKPGGWSDVMQQSVKAWAANQARQHRVVATASRATLISIGGTDG
jgi:hypothetical protein